MKTESIDIILGKLIDKNQTPSVVYVVFNTDSIIYQNSLGFTNIKKGKETSEKSRYNVFSITKTFTALAVLQLEDHGKLDINDPVIEYLPDFPYAHDITIRNLLTHTAGIPNPVPLSWIHSAEEHRSFDTDAYFSKIFDRYNKTKSLPNEKFAYSNLGYVILGQLVARVSGLDYKDYIRTHILDLLDIEPGDLDFEIGDPDRYATGYHKKLSFSYALLGLFMDKSEFMGRSEGKWVPFNINYVNGPSYGGLISTPEALTKYGQELLKPGCRIISDEYKDILLSENHTNDGKPTGMCLSWFKGSLNGKQYYAHAGGGGGYYCEIRIYPEYGIGSVIMFNRTGMKDERFLDKPDAIILNERLAVSM